MTFLPDSKSRTHVLTQEEIRQARNRSVCVCVSVTEDRCQVRVKGRVVSKLCGHHWSPSGRRCSTDETGENLPETKEGANISQRISRRLLYVVYLCWKGNTSSKIPQSWQGEGNLFDKLWN